MAQDAPNAQELKRLEAEARECEQSGDSLGALDIYEEMVRRGLAQASHMTALGHCYIENRQRQNARTIWLRALETDPNHEPCAEALDRYFSGWEKSLENPPPPRTFTHPRVTPPPPPLPSDDSTGGLSITVETTSTRQSPPPAPQPRPEAPAQAQSPRPTEPAKPTPQPQAAPVTRSQPLESVQAGMKSADAARVAPALDLSDPRSICWDFVLKDAAEEATLRPRVHSHH